MKILVLGNGVLANSIVKCALFHGHKAFSVSSRAGIDLSEIESISSFDTVIDTMDLPHDKHESFWSMQNRLTLIREKLCLSPFSGKYCYISSTNVYRPSFTSIDESSPVLSADDINKSPYLLNKIDSEALLTSLYSDRLLILRLVSLWSDLVEPAKKSFFSDLICARSLGETLAPRTGDREVISFMNYADAALLILKIFRLISSDVRICNISASCWSSRELLKAPSLCADLSLLPGRRITSMHYTPELLNCSFSKLP